MSEKRDVDVVVIGSGPAGENVAGRCADAGLSVVVVERELVGGECSYWGCIPSKTLIRPGDVLAAARRVAGAAEAVTGTIDTAAVFARRDYMVSNYDDSGQVPWLEGKKIELVRGTARLAGERTVVVDGPDGTDRPEGTLPVTLHATRAVVLATGTKPAVPPVAGLADVEPWDNRTATGATYVPRRLIVLGGGPIGSELAQAFRRLGSEEVTIVQGPSQLLGREEPFAAAQVREAMESEGITVLTGARMVAAQRETGGTAGGRAEVVVTLEDGRTIAAEEILVAVGRRPATEHLGLETVGLTPGRWVEVDDQLRAVGVPGGWLYAVGDVNGRSLFTHMGKYQARIAGDIIAGRTAADGSALRDVADDGIVTRVTFTDPQVCAVGLTEAAARESGIAVRVVDVPTGSVAGASVHADTTAGTCRIVVDSDRRVIVGATFTGPDTQEMLHGATIAIAGEVTLDRLWHAVPVFPTVSEVWLRLLEAYGL